MVILNIVLAMIWLALLGVQLVDLGRPAGPDRAVAPLVAEVLGGFTVAIGLALMTHRTRGRLLRLLDGIRLAVFWCAVCLAALMAAVADALIIAVHHQSTADFFDNGSASVETRVSNAVVVIVSTGLLLLLALLVRPSLLSPAASPRRGTGAALPFVSATGLSGIAIATTLSASSQVEPPVLGVMVTAGVFVVGATWRSLRAAADQRRARIDGLVTSLDELLESLRGGSHETAGKSLELHRRISEPHWFRQAVVGDSIRTPLTHVLGTIASFDLLSADQYERGKVGAMPTLTKRDAELLLIDAVFVLRRALVRA
ncbi:hypothetical protein [Curtobacterium oceanosedimentum]|uniref:hypothetical protein n=1 Tax=Curtobacterium oceanosedimentum TaxID=465820 RepID=UPI001AE1A828